MKLFLFGPPRLEAAGVPVALTPRKATALLAYLAVARQPHTRDALATLFWPENDQTSARAALRRTLYRLQQAVPAELLNVSSESIQLNPHAPLWSDVAEFQAALATANLGAHPRDHLIQDEDDALQAAIALYRDDFVHGFTLEDAPEFDEWQFFQREGLRLDFSRALHQRQHSATRRGDWQTAIEATRRRLALDPLQEPVHRDLIHLYAWAGHHAAALRQYHECVRILREELGADPEPATTELFEALRSKQFPAPSTAAPSPTPEPKAPPAPAPSGHIPTPQTAFVGRSQELTGVVNTLLIPECRLLTLVGMGGIGKTRLAIQVAQQFASAPEDGTRPFPDGAVFVPLATETDPSALVPAIADAAGWRLSGDVPPKQRLLEFLRTQRIVLVLDNFEQLTEAADFLSELLAHAPGVKLLVTSRNALPLPEAWFYPLGGMSYPANPQEPDAERYEAVQLFLQCARRARPDFTLAGAQEAAVTICRLVTGMPLAIELAAAWLRALPIEAVAAELGRGLDILNSRHTGMPPRHRSMRAVIEQSWALLEPNERNTFQQLAVMRGGFDLSAVTAITGATWVIISALVEKSILVMDGTRYTMHELLRQFALEQLLQSPATAEATYARFSAFYLDYLIARGDRITGDEQSAVLAEIDIEADNIFDAWQWAVSNGDLERPSRALDTYNQYIWLISEPYTGLQVFGETLAAFDRLPRLRDHPHAIVMRPRLLRMVAMYHYYIGQFNQSVAFLEQALEAADTQSIAGEILTDLATIAIWQGRPQAIKTYCRDALAIHRALGNRAGEADILQKMGRHAVMAGDTAAALEYAQASLAISRELHRPDWIGFALLTAGGALMYDGRYDEARRVQDEALAVFESVNYRLGIAVALSARAWRTWGEQGATPEVVAFAQRGLELSRQIGNHLQIAQRLVQLAQFANDRGEFAAGLRYATEALEVTRELGNPVFHSQALCYCAEANYRTGNYTAARSQLGQAAHLAVAGEFASRLTQVALHAGGLLLELTAGPAAAAEQHLTLAAQCLVWACRHPATWHPLRARARAHLARLRSRAPSAVAAAEALHDDDLQAILTAAIVAWADTINR